MSTYLKPSACARALGVTGAFIRGEINDGRLRARKHHRESGRSSYRIAEADFLAYVDEHWPSVSRGTKANQANIANTEPS